MKNNTILAVIFILCLFIALISTVVIVTQVILGYSGFQNINAKSNLIYPSSGCPNNYLNTKYGEVFQINMQVCFIFAMIGFGTSIICMFVVVFYFHGLLEQGQISREQTDIQLQRSQTYITLCFKDGPNNNLSLSRIIAMYVFVFIMTVTSYVPFNQYLQVTINKSANCQIVYNNSEITAISFLSFAILVASLIVFALLMFLSLRFNQRLTMLQLQNGSETYQQQMNRMLQEMPLTERVFYNQQQENIKIEEKASKFDQNAALQNSQIIKTVHYKDEIKESIIAQVHQVKSIIYRAQDQLMLQSIYQK